MSAVSQITTADELLRMPEDGYRYELIEGELRKMMPGGGEHGYISNRSGWRLTEYVERHKLGAVFGAETGFLVRRNPDTVLAPDLSFVRQARIDAIGIPAKFVPEAPALVVEVVSPNDTIDEVDEKIHRWFAAGVELAWVVHPGGRTVTVYRSLDNILVLTANDTLDGGDVVPGFSVRVGDLFAALDR
jgi:Uma2 family endonuclease